MKRHLSISLLILGFLLQGQNHPNLILTNSGVEAMRTSLGKAPLFDLSFENMKRDVDAQIELGIEVPLPKDLAGGYTHSRHKANFFTMQKAGLLFQISQEEKYAVYIKDMLLEYAELFPKFDKHPIERSYARGKFFWQCLNDANWLVYTSQAYDAIYDWLDRKTVKKLNTELFRPYAEFISLENPQFFNRIHNHSTWGNAAVGMIGLVMDDDELVKWAMEGLDTKLLIEGAKDNDGGDIRLKNQKEAGFFAQLDHSFSPEGYYTEGPYYQRYAMYPFLIFAQAIQNKKPELNILNYRNGMLINAVYVLIDLSNYNGEFFPINDAQKGMSLSSRELVTAISMAYFYGGKDSRLLSLIEKQGRVSINESGLSAAKAIFEGKAKKYKKPSRLLFDGKNGDEGAVSILRNKGNNAEITLLMKYAKHGMGHGHFDRLGFLLFEEGEEVFQDYGSARWVNIKHKDGGGYLRENKTWAKQSIAHNTVVLNRVSHFKGSVAKGDLSHGQHVLFDTSRADIQIMSAKETEAYPGWKIQRTMAILEISELEKPLILDLMDLEATKSNDSLTQIELPLYYKGELMSTNLEIYAAINLSALGKDHGYQHLWKEAEAEVGEKDNFQMTWFNALKYYTLTSVVEGADQVYFTRIGANDPKFNLRRDPGILLRRKRANTLFVQVYEMHGSYDRSSEFPLNSYSSIKSLKILAKTKENFAIEIALKSGEKYLFCFQKESESRTKNKIKIDGSEVEWRGAYYFSKF